MDYSQQPIQLLRVIFFLSLLPFSSLLKYSSLFLSIIRYKQIMIEEQPNALPSFCLLVEPPNNNTSPSHHSQMAKLEKSAKQRRQRKGKYCTSVTLLKAPSMAIVPQGLVCKLPNGQRFNLKVQLSAPKKQDSWKSSKNPFMQHDKYLDDRLRAIVEGPHDSLLDKFLSYFKYVQEQKKLTARMWQTRIFTDERKLICEEDLRREKQEKWWKVYEKMKVLIRQVDEMEEGFVLLK